MFTIMFVCVSRCMVFCVRKCVVAGCQRAANVTNNQCVLFTYRKTDFSLIVVIVVVIRAVFGI